MFFHESEEEDKHLWQKRVERGSTLTHASHYLIFMSKGEETKVSTNIMRKYRGLLHLSLKCVPGKASWVFKLKSYPGQDLAGLTVKATAEKLIMTLVYQQDEKCSPWDLIPRGRACLNFCFSHFTHTSDLLFVNVVFCSLTFLNHCIDTCQWRVRPPGNICHQLNAY